MHENTTGDITEYVSTEFQTHQKVSYYHSPMESSIQKAAEEMIRGVVSNSKGVFLWVTLIVDELCRGFDEGASINEVQTLLESLHTKLKAMFERIIHRIPLRNMPASLSSRYRSLYGV